MKVNDKKNMNQQEPYSKPGMYTYQTRVRYSECGASRQAGLSHILDYLQDACTFQAEELGIGLSYMQEHKAGWVLSSWQADLLRYPGFGETLRITTWPYDFYGFMGFRNFLVTDAAGEPLVRANSVWVFMDMRKNRPVKITPEISHAYQVQERLEMEYLDRKLHNFEAGSQKPALQIPRYFIDTNHHVNNAKYILLAEELLPENFQAARVRAEYKKPAVYGDLLFPCIRQQADCQAVKFSDREGRPYVLMEFYPLNK